MKESDVKKMRLMNREAAELFIDLDDVAEKETGTSMLGPTKPFLKRVLADTKDSNIPGAFNSVLNQRLTGQIKSAAMLK